MRKILIIVCGALLLISAIVYLNYIKGAQSNNAPASQPTATAMPAAATDAMTPVATMSADMAPTDAPTDMAPTAAATDAMTPTDAPSAAAESTAYHKITAAQAKQMMDAQQVTIIDVRRDDEFAAGHVPGAINVPVESIGDQMPAALPDKAATILVYCRTGHRSKQASDKLVALGYQNIYDFGGIVDWPYDVTKD